MRKLTEKELITLKEAKEIIHRLSWDIAEEGSRYLGKEYDELAVATANAALKYILAGYK